MIVELQPILVYFLYFILPVSGIPGTLKTPSGHLQIANQSNTKNKYQVLSWDALRVNIEVLVIFFLYLVILFLRV